MAERQDRFRIYLVISCIAAVYSIHAAVFGWYIADDAGISLAYARNIVRGFGPVLYPGALAVEGYSNPLWVMLLGLGSLLRLDWNHGIPLLKVLGLAFGAGTLALSWPLARAAYAPGPKRVWLAPALLALWTPFVFWSGAGLENGLYAFLLTLAALLQLREIEDTRRPPWSAVALLGVALTRPEGAAFFVAFLIHRAAALRNRRAQLIRSAAWAATFVGGFIVFLLLRYWIFGAWLPNTYYAKVTDRHITEVLHYMLRAEDTGRSYVVSFVRAWWPVLALSAVGIADIRRWRANLLFAGVLGGTTLYVVFVGGDFWPAGRFFTAALPFVAVAAQRGIDVLCRRQLWLQNTAAVLLLAFVATVSGAASMVLRRQHHEDTLISLQGRLERGQTIRFAAERLGVKDPLYMDPDIGGPTLAGLRVLDLAGLTDIHIARFQWYPEFFRQYVFEEQRPHFIRTHATWTSTSQITRYAEFAEQYAPLNEYRDERGWHGTFVRKDLLTGDRPTSAGPRVAASLRQAMEAARSARAREDQRERDGWIEYYADRGLHPKLLRAFRHHESAGTLPQDPRRLRTLYYGLLAAGEPAAADRVGSRLGHRPLASTVLHRGTAPVLSIVDARMFSRSPDPTSWVALYMSPLDESAEEYSAWVLLDPTRGGKQIARDRLLRTSLRGVARGATAAIEIPLYVPADEYDIRVAISRPGERATLCIDRTGVSCYLRLGTHPVGR